MRGDAAAVAGLVVLALVVAGPRSRGPELGLAPIDVGVVSAEGRPGFIAAGSRQISSDAAATRSVDADARDLVVTAGLTCQMAPAAVRDRTGAARAALCDDTMITYEPDRTVATQRPVPGGRPIDITQWGDGLALLVVTDTSERELWRTSVVSPGPWGRLAVLPDDVVEVVGGADVEALVVLTACGDVRVQDAAGEWLLGAEGIAHIEEW